MSAANQKQAFTSTFKQPHYLLFLFLSACVIALAFVYFIQSVRPYMGLQLALKDRVWTVQNVDPNGMAARAGIRTGDRPVEVNGRPANEFLQRYEGAGKVLGVMIDELTVTSSAGAMRQANIKGSLPSRQTLIELLTWFIACFVFWFTGFYVFLRRPRNSAAFLLASCSLVFGLAFSANLAGEKSTFGAAWFAVISTVLGPWMLLHFFLLLPEERPWARRGTGVYLIYLPAAVTLALLPFVGFADGQPVPWFRSVRLFEIGVAFLAVGVVAVLNYTGAKSSRTRQQMKVVGAGCLAALLPFVILTVLPTVTSGHGIIPTGFNLLFLGFIPLGLGYAVVARKLMDIDVIIRRGVVYGLITVVMAAILSAAVIPTVLMPKAIGVPEEIALSLGLGAVAAILFGPTKKGAEFLVDRLLYKDRYDYRSIIHTFSLSANSLKEIPDISRLTVGTSVHTLNLTGGCLFTEPDRGCFLVNAAQGDFADQARQEELEKLLGRRTSAIEFPNPASEADPDVSFILPLIAAEKQVGILCLGQKVSRQEFSPDDEYLLQGIVSVAAVALRSAMLVHDVSLRDTFVSIASHELRTPLTAITGYSELLLKRDPGEETRRKWLTSINDSSRRITAMVNDLLNVTRIQSGKLGLKMQDLPLGDILEERLALPRARATGHRFVVQLEPGLHDVYVDRDKFGQIITNLVSNAVKYSPNGGQITIAARNEPLKKQVIVGVSDQGIGIGTEDQKSLFKTFHRIQRQETIGIAGSGLGLYIVKEWTTAMGGDVWLKSEMDKGSTFYVAIPAAGDGAKPSGGGI